jgi:hypothetical protein
MSEAKIKTLRNCVLGAVVLAAAPALVLDALRVAGDDGRVYDAITPAAMQKATKVTEIQPTWKWTTKDPNP